MANFDDMKLAVEALSGGKNTVLLDDRGMPSIMVAFDLGDTEEQIAEKTGFSKTTIRRRLNIAKLNQDELKKKEQDENFQLTLKDLYELEKVKDIKTRDKILREATSSRDLVSRAQAAAAEAKRNENAKKLKEMLKKSTV